MFVVKSKYVILSVGFRIVPVIKKNTIKILALIFIFRDSQGSWRGRADQIFLPGAGFSDTGDSSYMILCVWNVCDAVSSGVLRECSRTLFHLP